MDTPTWLAGRPQSILLATDLSPRCDRALDRAVSLCTDWQSRLVALHVLEDERPGVVDDNEDLPSWRRPADPHEAARRRLQADIGGLAGQARTEVAEGDPADVISSTAEANGSELIVTGIASHEPPGQFTLGRTVAKVLRRTRSPVLVVRDRPRAPYANIVVAIDFSDSSRHALEAAAHLFAPVRLTVFHAYDAPMSGLLTDPASYRKEYREVAAKECDDFLQAAIKPGTPWEQPRVLIESGAPGRLLADYVRGEDVDLVVLGTHGRSALFEVLLGSVAREIIDWVPCDVLVAPEPKAIKA